MKKIKFIIPAMALALFSCDNYLDINDNPNELHVDQTSPEKFLPAAEVGAYRVQAISMNRLGSLYSNAMTGNVATYSSPFSKEMLLTVDNTFYSAIFENTFLAVNGFQKIINYPNADGSYSAFIAVSKICKAHYLQHIVDLYGDIPYTDAFKGVANPSPRYNDDQFVYRQLLGELDDARLLLDDIINGVNTNAKTIDEYDVMLQGDLNTWYQFANTVELRMLLRMSKNTGAVAAYRDARLQAMTVGQPGQAVAHNSFLVADVKIQPGYSTANDDQVNPYFFNFAYDANFNVTGRTLYAPSGHLLKATNTYARINYGSPAEQEVVVGSGVFYPNLNDPRRTALFGSASGTSPSYQRGVTQGSNVVDVFPPTGVTGQPSRIGVGILNPYAEVANALTEFPFVSGYVMTATESYFLQAEAALLANNGNIQDIGLGTPDTYFAQGVQASCDFYQVGGGAPAYLAAIAAKPNYGYDAAYTFDQNYHAIMYQKWIALIQSNAIESFIDYNRTGFPITPIPLGASQTRKPRRLIYPTSEYVANSANVPNVTQADVFAVTHPSHPFWMLGDPALGN